jgi:hypothetical protein
MQTIFEVSIQPAAGYLVNCQSVTATCLSIPIEFSKLYCKYHMKQKFCHLLFTLGNVNYWVTYANYIFVILRNMHYCINESIIYRRPLNSRECFETTSWVKYIIQSQSCAQLMIYHTVQVNTAYPHKNNLCCGRISVWAEGITSLVLYILCAIDLIHPYNIWFSC